MSALDCPHGNASQDACPTCTRAQRPPSPLVKSDKHTSSARLGRVLIVTDGRSWFVRRVEQATHNLDTDRMVYICDLPIKLDFDTAAEAAVVAQKWAEDHPDE